MRILRCESNAKFNRCGLVCGVSFQLTTLTARQARNVSTQRAIFAPARLFVSLDYPWAERETARSLKLSRMITSLAHDIQNFTACVPHF